MALMVRVTHLSGARRDEIDSFRQLPVKIGRSGECPLQFDPVADALVSTLHAELRDNGGLLEIVDLGSQNGTAVNGVAVGAEPVTVPNHAVLELGQGGPRVRLEYEEAAGIHFGQLEAEQRSKVVQRAPVPTERRKVYVPDEVTPTAVGARRLEELAQELSSNGPLLAAVLAAAVVIGLILVAVAIPS